MVCISYDKLPVKITLNPQPNIYQRAVSPMTSDYDDASSVASCQPPASLQGEGFRAVGGRKRRRASNDKALARLVDGWDTSRLHVATSRSQFACLFESPASMLVWQGFVNMPEEVQQLYLAARPSRKKAQAAENSVEKAAKPSVEKAAKPSLDKIPEEDTEDPRAMHPAATLVKRKSTLTKVQTESIAEAEDFVCGLDGRSTKDVPAMDADVNSHGNAPEGSSPNSECISILKDSSSESEDGFEKIPQCYASLTPIEDDS